MKKADVLAIIHNMPQEYKDTACYHIHRSNPVNDFVRNRAGACYNSGQGWSVYFNSRATKANMLSVLRAMLDAIAAHFGTDAARAIYAGYSPAWAAEPAAEPRTPLSVSKGNAKMGGIPSISLPAVVTCRKGAPCARKCYAAKLERIRPNVKAAYARNLALWASNPAAFEAQAIAAAMPHRYFRWHVSGDIVGPSYLAMMVRVANACPGTRFLCFTKRFELVNLYISERGPLPANLQILFSAWAGLDVPNPYNLPMTHVIYRDGTTTAPANHYVCGGNCTDCLCQGVGCWQLKPGDHLAFYEH